MSEHATELRYAISFQVVLKYFGQLCLVLARAAARSVGDVGKLWRNVYFGMTGSRIGVAGRTSRRAGAKPN